MFFLECTHLAKFYGKTEVFRDLNFHLGDAKCIGIQGPNGSGKSTLMKCLSGLLRPSEGTIHWEIDGRPVRNQELRYFAGFAAPYIQYYSELTVSENLSFLRQLRAGTGQTLTEVGVTDRAHGNESQLSDILELTGLSDLAGRDFGTLSSGQQQRVRLAGALVPDPLILMLDEPGTNLDADGISLVSRLVSRHLERGGLVFLSSNREEELALTGPRIVLSARRKRHHEQDASIPEPSD
jgi:ABC-type multidrug transport system ATPase subunit